MKSKPRSFIFWIPLSPISLSSFSISLFWSFTFSFNDSKSEILFIYRNDKWDLPKGKAEKNEQLPQTALREVKEETGIKEVSINKPLDITYHIFRRNNEYRLKVTYWFDMFSDYEGIFFPQLDEGITDVKWVKKADLEEVKINSYPNIRLLF